MMLLKLSKSSPTSTLKFKMGFNSTNGTTIALLICIVSLTIINVDTMSTQLKAANVIAARNLTATKNPTSSNTIVENGERANELPSKLTALVSKMFKTSPSPDTQLLQKRLEANLHPTEVFEVLHLGQAGAHLKDNPNLLQWFRYVSAFRKKNEKQFTDLDMYYLLLKTHSADELTTLFCSLKTDPGLKTIGKRMQPLVSGMRLDKILKNNVSPYVLFDNLRLKEANTKLGETPLFHEWLKYVDMYRAEKGDLWFSEMDMLRLIEETMPEENVVTLVHLLRQIPGMKDHADMMQRIMSFKSEASHKVMTDVWINSRETPQEVFDILRPTIDAFADNTRFILWLRYTMQYRSHVADNSLSDIEIFRFIQRNTMRSDMDYATLFQVIKDVPDLRQVGENIQVTIFDKFVGLKFKPNRISSYLSDMFRVSAVKQPKNDIIYGTLKDYTLFFAQRHGGETAFKKVMTLFADDNPSGAIAAADKFDRFS